MRLLIAAFAVLLLCAAPVTVYAQTLPQPSDVADSVERVGGVSNAIQLLFMVLLLVVAWRVAKPLIDSNTSANLRATELQVALMKRIEREDAIEQAREQVRQQTAGSLERTAIILSDLETRTQAVDGRKSAVEQVNTFTADAHKETQRLMNEFEGRLDKALEKLDTAYASIDNRLGAVDDTIRIKLEDVRGELNELKQSVDKAKGDTGELNPDAVPAVDPALAAHTERHADVAPEPPDIWQGDTPDNV